MLIASIQFNNDDYPYDKQIYIHEIYDRFYYSESSVGESVTYISENFTIGQSLKLIHECDRVEKLVLSITPILPLLLSGVIPYILSIE